MLMTIQSLMLEKIHPKKKALNRRYVSKRGRSLNRATVDPPSVDFSLCHSTAEPAPPASPRT